MARYLVPFAKGAANVTQIMEALADATRPRRLKLYDLQFGCITTPADAVFDYRVQRMTASGTGAAVTPQPLDPADAATEFDAKDTPTVDGTFTANAILLRVPLNHRASFRWVAAPGSELVSPATASNGLGLRLGAASTNDFAGSAYIEEQ